MLVLPVLAAFATSLMVARAGLLIAVLLLAIGLAGPMPLVRMRFASTPWAISELATESARCCDRRMFRSWLPVLSV